VAQAEALAPVIASLLGELQVADSQSLPIVAKKVRFAVGLIRRRFSSARGKLLELVSQLALQGLSSISTQGGDTADDDRNEGTWEKARIAMCGKFHGILTDAGLVGPSDGGDGSSDDDEWSMLRRIVFLATQ